MLRQVAEEGEEGLPLRQVAEGGEEGEGREGRALRRVAVEGEAGRGRGGNGRPPSEALRAITTSEAGTGNSLGLIWTSLAGWKSNCANFCRLVKRRVAYDMIVVVYATTVMLYCR